MLARFALMLSLLAALVCGSGALAQEADPARDALIVETLLRLDSFDLESKPKTKEAVLRYLAAHRGGESFFALIERFGIRDATGQLLELAVTQPNETAGVKGAALLLKLGANAEIDAVLDGDDTQRAAALVAALGSVGGKEVVERLAPLVTDEQRPLTVRSAAAQGLGKSKIGVELLLEALTAGTVGEDLHFTLANVLLAHPDPQVPATARKHLKLPAAAGEKPLPPLADLMKMAGSAERGKTLFHSTATCNKCHVVRGEGREVGPNLSEIGSKLSKEAFLVAILDPSAGISHNYETYVAASEDGKVVSGLLRSQTDAEIVIRDANAIDHTLPRDQLEEFRKLPISLMPADLQKLMSPQDLVDVVEYLLSLKKE